MLRAVPAMVRTAASIVRGRQVRHFRGRDLLRAEPRLTLPTLSVLGAPENPS